MPTDSLRMGSRGPLEAFLAAGAFFCFFALGGEFESKESSSRSGSEFSSSESGLGRFFEGAAFVVLRVVCVSFFDAAGALVVAFFAAAGALALIWT